MELGATLYCWEECAAVECGKSGKSSIPIHGEQNSPTISPSNEFAAHF